MRNYDFCFGCGFSCALTQALRDAGLQYASYPFDWTATPSFLKAAQMIATDFAHWLDREDLELVDIHFRGMNKRVYKNRRTTFGFVHDFSLFLPEEDAYRFEAEKYRRRAARLMAEIAKAKRVLVPCVEWPMLAPLRPETLREVRRLLTERFPGVTFDLVYFHVAEGATSAKVEREEEGITVVGCEYRKYLNGEIHHEIDNAQIVDFLKGFATMADPRTEAEKAKYAVEWKKDDTGRWKGRNVWETIVNRTAFRIYRKTEKFLMKKGLVPLERPQMFGTENEPR